MSQNIDVAKISIDKNQFTFKSHFYNEWNFHLQIVEIYRKNHIILSFLWSIIKYTINSKIYV